MENLVLGDVNKVIKKYKNDRTKDIRCWCGSQIKYISIDNHIKSKKHMEHGKHKNIRINTKY